MKLLVIFNSELDDGRWSPSVNCLLINQFLKMPREMDWGRGGEHSAGISWSNEDSLFQMIKVTNKRNYQCLFSAVGLIQTLKASACSSDTTNSNHFTANYNINLSIIQLSLHLPSVRITWGFQTKFQYDFPVSSTHSASPILLDLILLLVE